MSARERLQVLYRRACDGGKVLNVNNLNDNGTGGRVMAMPGPRSTLVPVSPTIPIVSSNPAQVQKALTILGLTVPALAAPVVVALPTPSPIKALPIVVPPVTPPPPQSRTVAPTARRAVAPPRPLGVTAPLPSRTVAVPPSRPIAATAPPAPNVLALPPVNAPAPNVPALPPLSPIPATLPAATRCAGLSVPGLGDRQAKKLLPPIGIDDYQPPLTLPRIPPLQIRVPGPTLS